MDIGLLISETDLQKNLTLDSLKLASIEQTFEFTAAYQEGQMPRHMQKQVNLALAKLDDKAQQLLGETDIDSSAYGFVRTNEHLYKTEDIIGSELTDYVKWKPNQSMSDAAHYGLPPKTYEGADFPKLRDSMNMHFDETSKRVYNTSEVWAAQSQKGQYYIDVSNYAEMRKEVLNRIEGREVRSVGTVLVDRMALEDAINENVNSLPLFMDADGNIPQWRQDIVDMVGKEDSQYIADYAGDNIAEGSFNKIADVVHQQIHQEVFSYTFKSPLADVEMTERSVEGTTRLKAANDLMAEVQRHIKIAEEKISYEDTRERDVRI